MATNDESWCSRCFATIWPFEKNVFEETGMCKMCQSKSTKLENSTTLKIDAPSSPEAELQVNVPAMLFIVLFALPPIDLFLGSNLPFGFFVLLRLVAFGGFGLMAYSYYRSGKEIGELDYSSIFVGLALLYNPIFPAELGRELWTLVNTATVGLLIHFNFFTTSSNAARASEAGNQKRSNISGGARPSSTMSRNFIVNYDKDVIAPLKLLKSRINDQDYLDNYDRIVDEFTLGFVHGFMAFATFQDPEIVSDYGHSLEKIFPFTDGVLSAVFSRKECVDLKQNLNIDLANSNRWQEGFEWGWRNCETWQSDGEVTVIWLDYVRKTRDEM